MNKLKYLSRSEETNILSFDCDGKVVSVPLAEFRADSEYGQCMSRSDLSSTLLLKGFLAGRDQAQSETYYVEVLAWAEHPKKGVLVKDNGNKVFVKFDQISQLKDRADYETWGELCWRRGFEDARTIPSDLPGVQNG